MLSIAVLSSAGCFPHDAHKRTLAQLSEGGAILTGIAIEAAINSGADCDQMGPVVSPNSSCRTSSAIAGDIGLGLILAGLVGFLATVSTAEDDKPAPIVELKAERTTEDKSALKLPPGVKGNATTAVSPAH